MVQELVSPLLSVGFEIAALILFDFLATGLPSPASSSTGDEALRFLMVLVEAERVTAFFFGGIVMSLGKYVSLGRVANRKNVGMNRASRVALMELERDLQM